MAGRGKLSGLTPDARSRFDAFRRFLQRKEPQLALEVDAAAGTAEIAGVVRVDVGAGVLREFKVSIRFEGLDPFKTPAVWDVDRTFRPDGDNHVEDHGARGWRFCLELDAAPEIAFASEGGLERLLSVTRGFIRKQLMYEDRKRRGHPKPWPGSEWNHGCEGHIQWVEEVLGDISAMEMRALKPYMTAHRLAGNKTCPCGSGRKAAICHRNAVELVRSKRHIPDVRKAIEELLERRIDVECG